MHNYIVGKVSKIYLTTTLLVFIFPFKRAISKVVLRTDVDPCAKNVTKIRTTIRTPST